MLKHTVRETNRNKLHTYNLLKDNFSRTLCCLCFFCCCCCNVNDSRQLYIFSSFAIYLACIFYTLVFSISISHFLYFTVFNTMKTILLFSFICKHTYFYVVAVILISLFFSRKPICFFGISRNKKTLFFFVLFIWLDLISSLFKIDSVSLLTTKNSNRLSYFFLAYFRITAKRSHRLIPKYNNNDILAK